MRHNGRHNKGKPKRPRGPHGYYRVGSGGAWPIAKLQHEFLSCVSEVGERAMAEYRDLVPLAKVAAEVFEASSWYRSDGSPLEWSHLEEASRQAAGGIPDPRGLVIEGGVQPALVSLRDALKSWAAKHYLLADWVLAGAVVHLDMAVKSGAPPILSTGVTFGTPPVSQAFHYHGPGYNGLDNAADYRKRALAAITEALDSHIKAMVARLEADPGVVADPFVDRRTLAAIRAAALWQVRGEYIAGDFRTIRSILERIGLPPRPGLSNGKTEDT